MKERSISIGETESLNTLRFLAFIHVFLQHAYGNLNPNILHSTIIGKIVSSYSYGTYTFLILSGYLITFSILKEVQLLGGLKLSYFYFRRWLRIWPLYFLFISIVFLVFPLLKKFTSANTVLATNPLNYYFFLSNFDILQMDGASLQGKNLALAITWTLSVLEQFYIIWPLLFVLIKPKHYWAIFAITLFASLGFSIANAEKAYMLRLHTLSASNTIIFGGLLSFVIIRSNRFRHFIEQLPRLWIIVIYVTGFTISIYSSFQFAGKYDFVLRNLFHVFLLLFVIAEQSFSKYSIFKLSKARSFGNWSKYGFGFYLFHMVALFIVHVPFRQMKVAYNESMWITSLIALLAFALTLLLSYLSFEFFEVRFIKLRKGFVPTQVIGKNSVQDK